MTGAEVREARRALGLLWGLDRPLTAAELGRALRLKGARPGETVIEWESKAGAEVTGPVATALQAFLDGWRPADLAARIGAAL